MPSVLYEYQQRLTTPEDAVQLLQSDTNIVLGVALNQPPALMGAIAQRLREGSLDNLRLSYQNAMQHMADTVLADDVLHAVHPHTFFLTEVDRRIVKQQRAIGKKILSYADRSASDQSGYRSSHGH